MNEEEQIDLLTQRVDKLEQEVLQLKKINGMIANTETVKKETVKTEAASEKTETPRTMPILSKSVSISMLSTEEILNKSSDSEKASEKNSEKKVKSLEGRVGKTVMGVLASVLIFISLILFANIFYEYIPDAAKVGIMFVIAIAMTTVGLIKMSKENKYYILFTSIAGCGVGALYIVSVVSFFVFHLYSELVMLILIAVWLAGTLILAKVKSDVFTYICNMGVLVATFMVADKWQTSFIALIMYALVVGALFELKQKRSWLDYIYYIQLPIVAFILCTRYQIGSVPVLSVATALMFVLLVFVNIRFLCNPDKKRIDKILNGIFTAEMFVMVNAFAENITEHFARPQNYSYAYTLKAIRIFDLGNIFMIVSSLIGLCIYYYLYYNERSFKFVKTDKISCSGAGVMFYLWFGLSAVFVPIVLNELIIGDFVGFAPAFIVLLVLGIILNDKLIRYVGYFWSLVFIADLPSMWVPRFWSNAAAYVIYAVIGIIILRKFYHVIDKYILTGAAVIYSIVLVSNFELFMRNSYLNKGLYDIAYSFDFEYIGFALVACISIIMNTRLYSRNRDGVEEKISKYIGFIFNTVVLVYGMAFLVFGTKSNVPATIVLAIFLPALSMINIKRIFTLNIDKMFLGIYTCFKFMILTIAFLARFDAVSYVVSVAGIALSIVFIAGGFKFKLKSCRIYGIALTMICIAKLIVADISYSSNVFRPIGFFVAGILCFGISLIYSKLEKTIVD